MVIFEGKKVTTQVLLGGFEESEPDMSVSVILWPADDTYVDEAAAPGKSPVPFDTGVSGAHHISACVFQEPFEQMIRGRTLPQELVHSPR